MFQFIKWVFLIVAGLCSAAYIGEEYLPNFETFPVALDFGLLFGACFSAAMFLICHYLNDERRARLKTKWAAMYHAGVIFWKLISKKKRRIHQKKKTLSAMQRRLDPTTWGEPSREPLS